MGDWIITSPGHDTYMVRVGNCVREHAESVVETLRHDSAHPAEFELHDADEYAATEQLPRVPARKPNFLRRLING